jgi:hypothetical protein
MHIKASTYLPPPGWSKALTYHQAVQVILLADQNILIKKDKRIQFFPCFTTLVFE